MSLNVYERQKSRVINKRKMHKEILQSYDDESIENFDLARAEKAAMDLGYKKIVKNVDKYL